MEGYKGIFFLCVALMVTIGMQRSEAADESPKCDCGVFNASTTDKTKETPVMMKSPQLIFECSDAGVKNCSDSCLELATASKDEGLKTICHKIENTEKPFVPTIYYKACNETEWTRNDINKTLTVCCKNKEVIACA